jgi:hypothetical protein
MEENKDIEKKRRVSMKRSPIWEYFIIDSSDESKSECNICKLKVPRGGSKQNAYTTSNMVYHLEVKHQTEYQSYLEKSKTIKTEKSDLKMMPPDSPRAVQITYTIAKMIALDFQPYSIVEDEGFKQLIHLLEPTYITPSRKTFTETIIPKLHKDTLGLVQTKIKLELSFASFTTDLWTASDKTSYMSLTLHYINDSFVRCNMILGVIEFEVGLK